MEINLNFSFYVNFHCDIITVTWSKFLWRNLCVEGLHWRGINLMNNLITRDLLLHNNVFEIEPVLSQEWMWDSLNEKEVQLLGKCQQVKDPLVSLLILFPLSNKTMGWFLDAKMFSAITSAELCELVSHLFLIFFPDADEGEMVKSGLTDQQQGENSADNISTFSFLLTPNQSSKSYLQLRIPHQPCVFLAVLVRITSRHLLSEECDHLGEVDWSRGFSNLQMRNLKHPK